MGERGGWARPSVGSWPTCLIAAGLILLLGGTRSFAQCDPDRGRTVDCDVWVDDCESGGSGTQTNPYCNGDSTYNLNWVTDHSADHATVCVYPGSYEIADHILDFPGDRSVTVVSTNGRDCTTIYGKVDMSSGPYLGHTQVLDGFTIEPIEVNGSRFDDVGISILGDTRTIRRCRVTGHAYRGITVDGSSAVIEDTIVEDNDLGGLLLSGSSATLRRCTMAGNHNDDGDGGAGLRVVGSSSNTLVNCTISDNETTNGAGGGMQVVSGGTVKLIDTIMSGNSAPSGGAVHVFGARAAAAAGDPCDQVYVTLQMQNCLVTCNEADKGGGISFDVFSGGKIVNTTFANNVADDEGGAIGLSDTCIEVYNSILWGDTNGSEESDEITVISGDPRGRIGQSIIEGGCPVGLEPMGEEESHAPMFSIRIRNSLILMAMITPLVTATTIFEFLPDRRQLMLGTTIVCFPTSVIWMATRTRRKIRRSVSTWDFALSTR